MRALVACMMLTGAACSFTPGVLAPPDATEPDAPPSITVGFATPTSVADEVSATVMVEVVLSAPATVPISVDYAITGGTASRPEDFLADDGTLTFAPGEVTRAIPIVIGADGMEEPDETIEITLQSVSPGAVLANAMHTLTISANVLPRVSFVVASSSLGEDASPAIEIELNTSSQVQVTISVAATGDATGGGVDYTLGTTLVTFAPGETSAMLPLEIVNDLLDENDEQISLQLENGINVIPEGIVTYTHTIEDDDDPPTVSFTAASSTVTEAAGMIDLEVQLSAPSGKDITVPFELGGTASNTDFNVPTSSPLSFPAGTESQMIRVNITEDTEVEPAETVVIQLDAPTNATLGAIPLHTLTIEDNDQVCLGQGSYRACFPNTTSDVSIASSNFDTDTSAMCQTPISGWTGQPDSCFVVAQNLTISGATNVTGARPLVLFASNNLSIQGNLDVASHLGGKAGPGAAGQACPNFTRNPANSRDGGGGGAGGTFSTQGGAGGAGDAVNNSGGTAPAPLTPPTTLRAGCRGQNGGRGNGGGGSNGGLGGLGGGALYLVAGNTISIGSMITINASGAGGDALTSPGDGFNAGGGGGGSGGMIKLHAANLSIGNARLIANGGGGSSGGDDNAAGTDGNDPDPNQPTTPAPGGPGNAGAAGGSGFAGNSAAQPGEDGDEDNGGGGGGGGGGFIQSNLPLDGATVSAGVIDV